MTETNLIWSGSAEADTAFLFAHGAGAPMDSPFMEAVAAGLAEKDIAVARFEFPYMQKRRSDQRKRPPDRMPVLESCFREVIETVRCERPGIPLLIGGKSMGGRVASMIVDDAPADGLICLGYPFHPPGKPDRTRTDHLRELAKPAMILQGERDALGNEDEVAGYDLAQNIAVIWIPDGDHDFKPRKSSGFSQAANMSAAINAIAAFAGTFRG